ncbi:MAG: DUF5058 family protein [Dethiobacteria bacterium]|nr:DUF5058 family protein [Dethiobacteria bacterium]
MDYLSIANNFTLYIIAAIVIIFIFIQTILYMRKAWMEALRLNIPRSVLVNSVKTSISISILPSIPIVLAVFVLVPLLGIPTPWLRLTVIGSAPFEMMAADMGAQAVGAASLGGAGFDVTAFSAALWLMSVGGSLPLLLCVLLNKKISTTYEKFRAKDATWMPILSGAALMALITTLMIEYLGKGLIATLTVITSFIFALLISVFGQKESLSWLKNFALALSIIIGMCAALLYTSILG